MKKIILSLFALLLVTSLAFSQSTLKPIDISPNDPTVQVVSMVVGCDTEDIYILGSNPACYSLLVSTNGQKFEHTLDDATVKYNDWGAYWPKDDNEKYRIDSKGNISKSTDYGYTWKLFKSLPLSTYRQKVMKAGGYLYVSGDNLTRDDKVVYSDRVLDFCMEGSEGYLIDNYGHVYRTADNGDTWKYDCKILLDDRIFYNSYFQLGGLIGYSHDKFYILSPLEGRLYTSQRTLVK